MIHNKITVFDATPYTFSVAMSKRKSSMDIDDVMNYIN